MPSIRAGVEKGTVTLALRVGTDLSDRCVSAVVGGLMFGIPIQHVQEILAARPLSRVFRAPPAIAGITSLRGEILPVLDLAVLLGVTPGAPSAPESLRIIVVRETQGLRRRAGLQVEALGPVRELPSGIAPVPATVAPEIRSFLLGILSEPPVCAVLDVPRMLDAPALAAIAGRQPEETL